MYVNMTVPQNDVSPRDNLRDLLLGIRVITSKKMGLKSVTTVQGVSVTRHSSLILDWAMHTTGGMGESVVASSIQTASYLAHSVAKSCTLIVIYTEFTADQ